MTEQQINTVNAASVCFREIEPDRWVSVEELNEINESLRYFRRSTLNETGVTALAWHENGQPITIAARLN